MRNQIRQQTAAMKKFGVGLTGLALTCFTFANPASAGTASYTTIDFPGAVFTDCVGINRFGDIVGHYIDAGGTDHGYLLRNAVFTTVDFPGSDGGHVHGINSRGDIVGLYFVGKRFHGYLLSGGLYTTIDYPGVQYTRAIGINEVGDIVGSYADNHSDNNTGGQHRHQGTRFPLAGRDLHENRLSRR
jgi:hypothetical protein